MDKNPNKASLDWISLTLYLGLLLLIIACNNNSTSDIEKNTRQESQENPVFFPIKLDNVVEVDKNLLNLVTANNNTIPAGKSIEIPLQGSPASGAKTLHSVKTDMPDLEIITPGDSGVPESHAFVLPEPTNSSLRETMAFGEFEVQYGDTVLPLSYSRAIQKEPDQAFPMRMKESAGFNMLYLGIEQGLYNPNINSLIEDSKGNIWFGIQNGGLCRYDGSYFTRFTQLEGLFQDDVSSVCEDSEGNIWAGTQWGVCVYDGSKFLFGSLTRSLLYNPVNTIVKSNAGEMWIGTTRGLVKFDNDTFSIYTQQMGLPSGYVESITEAKDGSLWIGTASGICSFDGSSFTQFPTLQEMSVRSIAEDDHGNIWFGGDGEGVYCYDGQYLTHYTLGQDFGNIHAICKDHNNQLWIGTQSSGLYLLRDESIQHYSDNEGLSSNTILSIFEDRAQNIWLATQGGGLMKVRQNSFSFLPKLNDISTGTISSIISDRNDHIWFSILGEGVARYDGNTFQLMSEKEGPNHNYITALFEDRTGNIWFGSSDGGLQKYDGEAYTPICKNDNPWEPFGPGQVSNIKEDSAGHLWWGTLGEGIKMYDGTFITSFQEPGYRNLGKILCILPDHSNQIWYGFSGGPFRLYKYDGSFLYRYIHYWEIPEIKMVTSIFKDSRGILWIGSDGGGLLQFDEDSISRLTEADGLSHNYISSIIEDNFGNIWVGTLGGLSQIKIENKNDYTITSFGVGSGLKSMNFNLNAVCLDQQHRLWWGTGEMVTSLDLKNFYRSTSSQPVVQLNTVHINRRYFDFGSVLNNGNRDGLISKIKFSGVSPFYNYPLDPVLDHDMNHLTFRFSASDWTIPQAVKYQYRMEGIDEQWSAPAAGNEADYRNIPPGKYKFLIRAATSSNKWSESYGYPFIIRRPWWVQWWAVSIYGLLFLLLINYYIRFRINRGKVQAEIQIKRLEVDKMKELDKLKSRFFANISHEFRTPLTLLLGPINDLLKNHETPNKDNRSLLGTMKRNAERLQQLINQLLDLSKLETGKMPLQVSEGDLNGFLKVIISSFVSQAERLNIRYEYELAEATGTVFFDSDKIQKILTNLISNALKFTPSGGRTSITMSYSGDSGSSAGMYCMIKVKDTGIGIHPEQKEKIFDRFYQAGGGEHHQTDGTGIGLALTSELVGLYKGSISLESIPGEGSTFTVNLPVSSDLFREEEIHDSEDASSSPPAVPDARDSDDEWPDIENTPDPALIEEIILLVEDNRDLRNYMTHTLSEHYHLLEAENGSLGLEMACDQIPDLVISDLMMPEMDGIELCGRLRTDQRTSHIPLIMLTAKADRETRLESLETGADDFILKPFDAEELLVRVRNLIEQRKILREKFRLETMTEMSENESQIRKDPFLERFQDSVSRHLQDAEFGVDDLGREVGLSRSQLYRKIMAIAGVSPTELIRSKRLNAAAKLFQEGHSNVSEVMYSVGFNSPSNFAVYFRNLYGINPKAYIRQHAPR